MGRVVCLEEAQDWRAEVAVREEEDDTKKGMSEIRTQVGNGMEGIVDTSNEQENADDENKEERKKQSHLVPLKGPFICTVDEINEAFNSVKSVRYSQPIVLSGTSLSLLALSSIRHLLPQTNMTPPFLGILRSACTGVLSHLLLTPYSSGHTLGGTVFKIRSPTSGTILYAVGMNHTQERHLDGTVILNPGKRSLRLEVLVWLLGFDSTGLC